MALCHSGLVIVVLAFYLEDEGREQGEGRGEEGRDVGGVCSPIYPWLEGSSSPPMAPRRLAWARRTARDGM